MTDAPKLRPFAVAMLFSDGTSFSLNQGIIGAPSKEMAAGQCVLDYTRQTGCTMPLMIVHVTEIDDASVRLMFKQMVAQKPGEVVPMKVVDPSSGSAQEQIGKVLSQQSVPDGIAGRYILDPEPAA